jgi:hypothetical protein
LIGDDRSDRTFRGTVQGIIGSESLVCAQIASCSPQLATDSRNGAQRVRRMAKVESTKRSALDADHLIGRLRARGIERLADQEDVGAIVDPSGLRKPYAQGVEHLMEVRALGGDGTAAEYRTHNVLGVDTGGVRAVLSHTSSGAPPTTSSVNRARPRRPGTRWERPWPINAAESPT